MNKEKIVWTDFQQLKKKKWEDLSGKIKLLFTALAIRKKGK